MKRGDQKRRLSLLLLILLLFWRMLGAPITLMEWQALQTPLWQARVLMPSRVFRVVRFWMPVKMSLEELAAQSILEESYSADEIALEKLQTKETSPMLAIYDPTADTMRQMSLESYVCGVVAAEMPATYHMQALMAQAVAARTRAMMQMAEGGCALHKGADLCMDSTHCQGYADVKACKEKWGAEYEVYRDRILQAVQSTKDEHIVYEGELIQVMYHAMSGGMTEAAETVFSQAVPYLVSVTSEGEEDEKGFLTDTTFTYEEIASKLCKSDETLSLTAEDVKRSLMVVSYTPTGRIDTLTVGDVTITGTDFRRALGLRSTWFSFSTNAQGITFHQRGYGHGVGMSQTGANNMAAVGASYVDILQHYYPNTAIVE